MSGAIPLFAEHFVTASIIYMRPLPKGEATRSIPSQLIGEPDRIIKHNGLVQEFDWRFTDINDADEEAWQGFFELHKEFSKAGMSGIQLPEIQLQRPEDENTAILCDNLINTIPYPKLRSLLFKWQDEFEGEGAELRSIAYSGHPLHDSGRGHAVKGHCMGTIETGKPTHGQGNPIDLDFLIPPGQRRGAPDDVIEFTLK